VDHFVSRRHVSDPVAPGGPADVANQHSSVCAAVIDAGGHRHDYRLLSQRRACLPGGSLDPDRQSSFPPRLLNRLVRRIQIEQEIEPLLNSTASMVLCGAFTLLGYIVARPFTSLERLGNNTLAIAITLLLTGFFLMFNRRKAITQVLALLTVENGVMLAAVALTTYGMPLVVELGIFFDVMVAVMVLGILVYRIRETFSSMDVSKLSQLKG
jgi:hypothetical protein